MPLLDDTTKFPQFTLRRHTHSVTALCIVHVPVRTETPAHSTESAPMTMAMKPFLISGDDSGLLILWDFATRRLIKQWQGHQSNILTIQQMGASASAGVDSSLFGMLSTHGRDNCVRFWRLFDGRGKFQLTQVYELPENALNFCNIDHCDEILVTPNTLESGTFDVYDLGFLSEDKINDHRLKRLLEGIDVFALATDKGHKFDEFNLQRQEDEVNRVDKFGIIMRLLLVRRDLLVVGYESGHVVTLKIDYPTSSVKILSINAEHFPKPVLSVSYDPLNAIVASTSISSQVVFHDINAHTTTTIKLQKFGKIGALGNINDKYILASWDGLTKFYTFEASTLKYQSSFTKPKGMIAGDLNTVGNLQEQDQPKKSVIKPNVLALCDRSPLDPSVSKSIGRRDLAVIESTILTIGYDDGTIAVYMDF